MQKLDLWIAKRARQTPHKFALIQIETNEAWSYKQLMEHVNGWSSMFNNLQLQKAGEIGYGQIMSFGLPLFFSTVLLSVQMLGSNYVASTYLGDGGLIALAVCMQLFSFSMIILSGTLRTIQPVGSILKGLGDDRGMVFLMQRAYTFLIICLAIYTVALIAFPTQISALLGATNEASLPIILKALPLFSLHIIMQALLYNLMPVYQFYNHKRLAFFLSIAQTLLLIRRPSR